MIRFLVRTLIFLASAAIGIIAAAVILDGVSVSVSGFILTVAVYAVVQSVMSPFLLKFAMPRRWSGGSGWWRRWWP